MIESYVRIFSLEFKLFSLVVKNGNRPFVVFNVVCWRVIIQHYEILLFCGGRVARSRVSQHSQVRVLCPYTWVIFSNKYDHFP